MDNSSLRNSLKQLDNELLVDGFTLLYEEFKGGKVENNSAPVAPVAEPVIPNFTSLILYLKGKYNFAELEDLTVDGGRVFFKRGGRHIELSRDVEDVIVPPTSSDSKNAEESAPRFRQLEMN